MLKANEVYTIAEITEEQLNAEPMVRKSGIDRFINWTFKSTDDEAPIKIVRDNLTRFNNQDVIKSTTALGTKYFQITRKG